MKIVQAKEMARIEKLAYMQGASEEEFMNKAGLGVAKLVQDIVNQRQLKLEVLLLCGSGNNAGDAYVAGRILCEQGFQVKALALTPFEKCSALNQKQSTLFLASGGYIEYLQNHSIVDLHEFSLVIDGLFGTGFHGKLEGIFKAIVEQVNDSGLPILAIDIPSGINGTTGEVNGNAIRASHTLCLGLPKAGCFTKEAWNYVGNLHIYNFGLDPQWIEKAETYAELIEEPLIKTLLPKIERTRHKYQAGYVIGIGGSKNMPGAPLMASLSALRGGAGIVRLLYPHAMEAQLVSAPYEIIRQGYPEDNPEEILTVVKGASALFIGPGMGTSFATLNLLRTLLPQLDKPCVIDADALNVIAEHDLSFPTHTLITPHQGEMKRLLKIKEEICFKELLERSALYSEKHRVTLLLKGPPTYIFHPNSKPYILSRGDPGMATAGSGDVLTGILAAFLAQTQDLQKTAILGSYFHAVAGEYAAETWSSSSMIATDMIASFPKVFKSIRIAKSV